MQIEFAGIPEFAFEVKPARERLALWCFDLLAVDGVRLMPLPLEERKAPRRPRRGR